MKTRIYSKIKDKVKVAVITLILLLFSSLSANAATYHVATTGNDANSGSEISPYRSVQRGADVARAGDTVYIMAGTYNESGRTNPSFNNPPRGIVLQYSGVSGSPITFKPYPGHEGKVMIDQCATGPTTSCAQNTTARAYAGFILPPGRGYIVIEGLEIRNASTAGIWVASSPGDPITRGVVIRNNHIHDIWGNDNTGGIRPDLTDGILIEGNRIHDVVTGGSGIHNASAVHTYLARNGTIRNNELYNARNGVFEKWPDPQKGLNVTANIIHDVSSGIRIGGATGSDVAHDVQISQNVIFNASSCVRTVPELVAPTTGLQVWNNTFVDCGGMMLNYFPDARVWNNIIATSVNGGNNYSTYLMLVNDRSHLTYSNYNLFYFYPNIPQNYAPVVVGETGSTYYSLAQWRSTTGNDANSIANDPLFVDKANQDFHLQSSSPAKGKGLGGVDMGAYATGNEIIGPTDGGTGGGGGDTGGNPPPNNSGGDSSSSGGSGCGFVKDINGKGQGAKGEGVAFMLMLIITLAGVALAKRIFSLKEFILYKYISVFLAIIFVILLNNNSLNAAENTDRTKAEAVCQRSDVIFCENWEDGDHVGWADWQPINSVGTLWGGMSCESGGCEFNHSGYNSDKALWLRQNVNERDTMYPRANFNTSVGVNDTVYMRYNVYWSPGFEFNVHGNKNSYFETPSGIWRVAFQTRPNRDGSSANITRAAPYVHFYCGQIDVAPGSDVEVYCYDSGGDMRYFPNQPGYENFKFSTGQWYSVEMMVRPNPVGSSFGGRVRLWVDGVLIIDNDNVSVRHATATDGFSGVWLSIYFGGGGQTNHPDQYALFDNIVVSKSYIGPMGGGGDTPPPSGGNIGNSGSDTSASGGSGCGFVRNINGKGLKANGEGLSFAIILIITLAGIALVRKMAVQQTQK